jgi:hypothetical protein
MKIVFEVGAHAARGGHDAKTPSITRQSFDDGRR